MNVARDNFFAGARFPKKKGGPPAFSELFNETQHVTRLRGLSN
jgi:hypothetical protein